MLTMEERVARNRQLKSSERRKLQLKRLYFRQNGKCFWCHSQMVPPWQSECGPNGPNPKPHFCTLDHLDDKFDESRRKHNLKFRRVAACWKCNNERAEDKQRNLPIEELWRRSGRAPIGYSAMQPSTDSILEIPAIANSPINADK